MQSGKSDGALLVQVEQGSQCTEGCTHDDGGSHDHIAGLIAKLQALNEPVLFIGTDVDVFWDKIKEMLGECAIRASYTVDLPRASELIALAETRELPAVEAVHNFVPQYRRIAEAEANWIKEQKQVEQ